MERAVAGDIVSIAGVGAAGIADTVAAPEVSEALPPGGPCWRCLLPALLPRLGCARFAASFCCKR